MKKFLFTLVLLAACISLFAYDGMMSGTKNLKVISSKWFDIIYPEGSEKSASVIYNYGDAIYEDLFNLFGYDARERMPVVITPAVESFNAYWSNSSGNHIVLYDTAVGTDMNTFSDSLLSTFRHELTHAYTYNMHGKVYKFIKKIFGDAVNPAGVIINSGIAEGATLLSESLYGEGRLNDEYSKHMVKQAKIENKFPKFHDMYGARDVYPYGSFYNFNGAFAEWLKDSFGIESYARFWYYSVNLGALTAGGAFKKAYGTKIKSMWDLFTNEYKVPDVHDNPVKAEIAEDFFNRNSADYSAMNNKGSLYSNLCMSERGLVYLDESTNKVYYVPSENLDAQKIKPKELFQKKGIDTIHLSDDGNFVAAGYISAKSAAAQARTCIYNMQSHQFYEVRGHGLFEPAVIRMNGEYYLIGKRYTDRVYSICAYRLETDGKRITDVQDCFSFELPVNTYPYSFTQGDDGTFAFVTNCRYENSIVFCDAQGNITETYKLNGHNGQIPGTRITIRNLSRNKDGSYNFSWAGRGTLPRYGQFKNGTFAFDNTDISGGIFYPVMYEDRLIYAGNFYNENRILCRTMTGNAINSRLSEFPVTEEFGTENFVADFSDTETESIPTAEENLNQFAITSGVLSSDVEVSPMPADYSKLLENAVPYKPMNFLYNHILLPICDLYSTSILYGHPTYSIPYGVKFITASPWDKNQLAITAGYGAESKSGAIGVEYSSGTATSLFLYTVSGVTELDAKGWKQSELSGNISSVLPFGNISKLKLKVTSKNHYGRDNFTDVSYAQELKDTNIFRTFNRATLEYSNIRVENAARNSYLGLRLGTAFTSTYVTTFAENATVYENVQDVVLYAVGYIPKLIPIHCTRDSVYNLPVRIGVSLFETDYYSDSSIELYERDPRIFTIFGNSHIDDKMWLKNEIEVILYQKEIQHAFKLLNCFYGNNIAFSAGCHSGFRTTDELYFKSWKILDLNSYFNSLKDGASVYSGEVYFKFVYGLSPNIGGLASLGKANIYFELPLLTFGDLRLSIPRVGIQMEF